MIYACTYYSLAAVRLLIFVTYILILQIPIDLSGDLNLLIYLWLMFGAGKGCICHIEVHQKPGGTSLAGQKVRVHNLLQQGVKVAWNQHVQFELHGICSALQGKGDFAIQAVKIGMNPQVWLGFIVLGYYEFSNIFWVLLQFSHNILGFIVILV